MKRILLALSVAVLIVYACSVNLKPEKAASSVYGLQDGEMVAQLTPTTQPEKAELVQEKAELVQETGEEAQITETLVPLGKEQESTEEKQEMQAEGEGREM